MIINDPTFEHPPRMPGMTDEQYAEHCKILDRSRKPTPERAARWKAEDQAERDEFTDARRAEMARVNAGHVYDPDTPLTNNGVVVVSRAGPHWQVLYRLTGGTWADLYKGQVAIPAQTALRGGWEFSYKRTLDFVMINAEIDATEFERWLGEHNVWSREGLKAAPDRWVRAHVGYGAGKGTVGVPFMGVSLDQVTRDLIEDILNRGDASVNGRVRYTFEPFWVARGVTLFDLIAPEYLPAMHQQALARYEAERQAGQAAA